MRPITESTIQVCSYGMASCSYRRCFLPSCLLCYSRPLCPARSIGMPYLLRPAFVSVLLSVTCLPTPHVGAAGESKPRDAAEIEAPTRLQVFLDRAGFAPGKIDGRYGEFTVRALALYRQSLGGPATQERAKGDAKENAAPDLTGLDLASVEPLFLDYTVTEADLKNVGELADEVQDMAKAKSMPYKTAAEAIAEKFHSDLDFLAELNPGKIKDLKAGDTIRVPSVEPFDLPAVRELKPGSDSAGQTANIGGYSSAKNSKGKESHKKNKESSAARPAVSVKIDLKTNMLAVYEGDKVIAAYPVTVGSGQTESPIGDWTVRGVATMPDFRYDEAMLKKGERSSKFHILPPGPNNFVGVIWIALNKKGIGLHGTDEPDSIGRSVSHGCVRMANWDVVRLAAKVKAGVAVSIH